REQRMAETWVETRDRAEKAEAALVECLQRYEMDVSLDNLQLQTHVKELEAIIDPECIDWGCHRKARRSEASEKKGGEREGPGVDHGDEPPEIP
ncbi:MAG: hypothetical protein WC941_10750, partial [Candidatus Bathyarchaeia archaeon]